MSDETHHETLVGYLMDIACVRKAPSTELLDRASVHTTECALMGHCIESGFALIDDEGRVHLLEPAATTDVVRELLGTDVDQGLQLRVIRERDVHEMHTVDVHTVAAAHGS